MNHETLSALLQHKEMLPYFSACRTYEVWSLKCTPSPWRNAHSFEHMSHSWSTKPWVLSFGTKNFFLFEHMTTPQRLECFPFILSACATVPSLSLSAWVHLEGLMSWSFTPSSLLSLAPLLLSLSLRAHKHTFKASCKPWWVSLCPPNQAFFFYPSHGPITSK